MMFKTRTTAAVSAASCSSDEWETRFLEEARDLDAALLRYRRAAAAGGMAERFALAHFLSFYQRSAAEREEAAALFKQLAKAGYREAIRALAWEYETGGFVRKNARKAFRWFAQLAIMGDVQGELCVSACYREGIGIEPNPGAADRWLRYAHKDGSLLAEGILMGGIREILEKSPFYTRNDPEAA